MRRALLLFAFLSLVIIGLLVTLVFMRQSSHVAVLPSGASIEFLGSAIGDATFTTEKSWHRFARRVLPWGMADLVPPTTSGSCSSGSNSVTYYFRVIDPSGAAGGPTPWSNFQAEDDVGFRYDREGGSCSFGGGSGGSARIYGLSLRSFPRRQADFQFHLLASDGSVMTTLHVPNAVRGPFPQWQPQGLPQTKTNGAVALTLESMREGGNAKWPMVTPQWKLNSSDPAWAGTKLRHAAFHDATGNEGMHLSPRESAWKFRALVFRERSDSFAATERLVITNLPVPAAANFINLDQNAERLGVKLTAVVLAGPGRLHITNGVGRGMSPDMSTGSSTTSFDTNRVESWGGPKHFLLLEAQNVQANDEILMRFTDEQGREIKVADSGGYGGRSNGARMYKRTFTPAGDAKSLNLEIIVNRPLIFEFMINPADVQPANSPTTKQ